MKPLISVLMSVYNESETFIRESISSMLIQTFKEFELIIIIDNPDREDVVKIINSFNDSRIIYLKNTSNIGLAMSMNKAAQLAKSNIFVRMDADDVALPLRFELEYHKLLQSHSDLIFSAYLTIDEEGNFIKENINECLIDNIKLRKKIAVKPNLIHHPTVMFTREIFERVGGYRNFPCAQDADLWMRMAEAGCNFIYLPNVLLKYRINSQGVTQTKWFKQQLTVHYIYKLGLERMLKGRDNYSIENYNFFLKKSGIDNSIAERTLLYAHKKLILAQHSYGLYKYWLRISAFLLSRELRLNYLISLYKVIMMKN